MADRESHCHSLETITAGMVVEGAKDGLPVMCFRCQCGEEFVIIADATALGMLDETLEGIRNRFG
jgi:hypothetical protein